MLNSTLVFKALIRQHQNSLVNCGSQSPMIYLVSPWCTATSLKKAVAILTAVVELRGIKLHVFENLSTTVITVEQPLSSSKSMIKSM